MRFLIGRRAGSVCASSPPGAVREVMGEAVGVSGQERYYVRQLTTSHRPCLGARACSIHVPVVIRGRVGTQ